MGLIPIHLLFSLSSSFAAIHHNSYDTGMTLGMSTQKDLAWEYQPDRRIEFHRQSGTGEVHSLLESVALLQAQLILV
jgi:hypothetical protein